MKTRTELEAMHFQEKARLAHGDSRYRITMGTNALAKRSQERSAYLYRVARAWMGVTNGDVKKADQPLPP